MMRAGCVVVIGALSSVAAASPCENIAVDRDHVYFVDGTDVFAAPRAGGPSVLLVEDAVPYDGGCLIADGTRLLYAWGPELRAVSPNGGAATTVATLGSTIADVTREGTDLVVATDTELHVVPATGKRRLLARSKDGIDAIAADATTVYWADSRRQGLRDRTSRRRADDPRDRPRPGHRPRGRRRVRLLRRRRRAVARSDGTSRQAAAPRERRPLPRHPARRAARLRGHAPRSDRGAESRRPGAAARGRGGPGGDRRRREPAVDRGSRAAARTRGRRRGGPDRVLARPQGLAGRHADDRAGLARAAAGDAAGARALAGRLDGVLRQLRRPQRRRTAHRLDADRDAGRRRQAHRHPHRLRRPRRRRRDRRLLRRPRDDLAPAARGREADAARHRLDRRRHDPRPRDRRRSRLLDRVRCRARPQRRQARRPRHHPRDQAARPGAARRRRHPRLLVRDPDDARWRRAPADRGAPACRQARRHAADSRQVRLGARARARRRFGSTGSPTAVN